MAVAALVAPMKNTRAWRPLVARLAEIRSVIDERGDEPLPHAGPRSAEVRWGTRGSVRYPPLCGGCADRFFPPSPLPAPAVQSILRFLIGANALSHSKLDVRVQAKELAAALAQAVRARGEEEVGASVCDRFRCIPAQAGGFGAIEGMLGGVSERAVEEIRELV